MALLEIHALGARYGEFQALFDVDLVCGAGESLAVIGANGAGKTTLMRSVAGLIDNDPDSVRLDGEPIGACDAPAVFARGVATVPEGRKLFPSLDVEENLLIGRDRRRVDGPWSLETVHALFPVLAERCRQPATSLSGGQQQMVAIGRALMSNPRVLLCDELSLGLAPPVVRDIYAAFPRIRAAGTALLIVEQDVSRALAVCDRAVCLRGGRVVLEGAADGLSRQAVHEAYFGAPGETANGVRDGGPDAASDTPLAVTSGNAMAASAAGEVP